MDTRCGWVKGNAHPYFVLYMHVYGATILDPQANIEGAYSVSICGHGQHNQTWTDFVLKQGKNIGGELRIKWSNYVTLHFPFLPNGEFLNLEVIKLQDVGGDPGTSNGVSVIGRAKIPVFPTTEEVICVGEPLYGPFAGEESQMTIVGNINVSFKLEDMSM